MKMVHIIKSFSLFLLFIILFVTMLSAIVFLFIFLISYHLENISLLITFALTSFVFFVLGTIILMKQCFKNMTSWVLMNLVIALSLLVFFVVFFPMQGTIGRIHSSKASHGLWISRVMREYAENHDGYLPETTNWCDVLLDYKESFERRAFTLYSSRVECNFALNKNVAGKKLEDLPDNTVLVFGSKGDWNLSGTEELFNKRKSKHRFVFVYSRMDEINETTNEVDNIVVIDFTDKKYESVIWDPGEKFKKL